MPNHRLRIGIVSAILLLSFQGWALAETVQGRVMDSDRNGLDMTVYDQDGRPYPHALHIAVDSRTHLDGVTSSAQLRRSDPVMVNVRQGEDGQWRADSINLLSEATVTQAPPPAPSPALHRSLSGQKMFRNALLGAGTGAIASSASGGKAGKGALIGAGVGLLGGFLTGDNTSQDDSNS